MRTGLIFLTFFCAIGAIYAASLANFEPVEDVGSFDAVGLHKRQGPAVEELANEEAEEEIEEEEVAGEEDLADEEGPADPAIPDDPAVPANSANPADNDGGIRPLRPWALNPVPEQLARRRPFLCLPVRQLPVCRPRGPRPCRRIRRRCPNRG